MGYFVYILKSVPSGKFYKGSSDDPDRRLIFHNSIEKGFTSRYRPWKLVWKKEYPSKAEAQKAEKKIKAWKSTQMIEKLIRGEIDI